MRNIRTFEDFVDENRRPTLPNAWPGLAGGGKAPARYPAEATDLNSLPDADGFWKLTVEEAKRISGTRFAPKEMGDLVFFLNMVASAWTQGRRP